MGAWTSVLSAGPLPSAASEKTPSNKNARAPTILKPVHNSLRNHVSETARTRTALILAHNSRHNHVGVTARARTMLTTSIATTSASPLAPPVLLLSINTGDSFAPSVALFGLKISSNVRPLPTDTAAPAPLSTYVGRHETCDMSNSN